MSDEPAWVCVCPGSWRHEAIGTIYRQGHGIWLAIAYWDDMVFDMCRTKREAMKFLEDQFSKEFIMKYHDKKYSGR